jgi:hypothetical protein
LTEHPLMRAFPDRVFVYDERDFPVYVAPGIYVGAPVKWSSLLPVVGGPYPTSSSRAINKDEVEPDLLFSFRGALTHPVRAKLLGLSHPRAVLERSDDNMFRPGQKVGSTAAAHRQHFLQLVERSKFVLCPRGHGLSSFRLYEVLAAGRVPVVISDGWLPPARLDWERSVVRIRECDAGLIPRRLEQLEERWGELAAGARSVAAELEPDRLWDHYAESVAQLANQPRRVSPFGRLLVYQRRTHLLARRLRNASA